MKFAKRFDCWLLNPKTVAEPSGAVATAGFLFRRDRLPQTKLNVAIISGGNIDPKMLEELRQEALHSS